MKIVIGNCYAAKIYTFQPLALEALNWIPNDG